MELDSREWLLTNGLGSFASGTVSDARTRTYHGWLIAALAPPYQRTLLLSHLEATLEVAGCPFELATNFWGGNAIAPLGFQLLQSFEIDPIPTWVWGDDHWQLRRQLVMPCAGVGVQGISTPSRSSILIQYRYEGKKVGRLRLRLLIGDRDFHHQQQAVPTLQFSQSTGQQYVELQAIRPGWMGTRWQLRWTAGEDQIDPLWYWNYHLIEEKKRGLGNREDLFSPGYLTVTLDPGAEVTLEARLALPEMNLPHFTSSRL